MGIDISEQNGCFVFCECLLVIYVSVVFELLCDFKGSPNLKVLLLLDLDTIDF